MTLDMEAKNRGNKGDNMKKPICPFNYMEAMRDLLDISHDEYREIYNQLQELIDKSENLLYTLDRDKDVVGKKWWLDERAQLSEAIENAKKR